MKKWRYRTSENTVTQREQEDVVFYSFRWRSVSMSRGDGSLVPFFFFISQIFIKLHNCPFTHNRENSSLSQVFTICAHLNSRPCGRLKGIKRKKKREKERSWKSEQREARAIYSGKFKRERESLSFINRRKISFSLSKLIRNETRCEKKKSQFIGEKWQDRVTRVILSFHALCILIAIRIKIAVYIFHCRWRIKKKGKKKDLDRG